MCIRDSAKGLTASDGRTEQSGFSFGRQPSDIPSETVDVYKRQGLKNKFQIAGCLDEPVHVLEQSLRGYTRVYLGSFAVIRTLRKLTQLAVYLVSPPAAS